MPKLKEVHSGLFGAADLNVLEAAVTDAWGVLSNPQHRSSWSITREDVARYVIAEATRGERDQAKLTTRVVSQLLRFDDT